MRLRAWTEIVAVAWCSTVAVWLADVRGAHMVAWIAGAIAAASLRGNLVIHETRVMFVSWVLGIRAWWRGDTECAEFARMYAEHGTQTFELNMRPAVMIDIRTNEITANPTLRRDSVGVIICTVGTLHPSEERVIARVAKVTADAWANLGEELKNDAS